MRLVILESPFAGDVERNLEYGRLVAVLPNGKFRDADKRALKNNIAAIRRAAQGLRA